MTTALTAEDVHFAYDGHPVLSGVSFSVDRGTFVALAGPNGSGKSTLVRILVGLLRPDRGAATVLGSQPQRLEERWRLGYVPQRSPGTAGLPATVEEVVGAGRLVRTGWRRRLRADDQGSITHALESVGMADARDRRYVELSGGQQQRVLIAKALAAEPEVLILDEPTAGVDAESQRLFRDALVHLVAEHRAAILLVSHELSAVADDLDRVIVVRRGTVAFDGAPGELTRTGVSLGIHASDLPAWLEDGPA